jgi:UDP-N-acetylmuramyl pentapeptide phosphotransferase/UDP-N-acetylglucosamine-1-phosphate transferase
MTLFSLALIWISAMAASLAVTGFACIAGLGDAPDARSSHVRVTPTAGGLGLVAGLSVGLWMAAHFLSDIVGAGAKLSGVLALLFAMGLVGLYDDVFALRARIKFALICLLAVVAVRFLGPVPALPFGESVWALPPALGFAGTVLWIIVAVNAVNFMDGINGIMAGVMNFAVMGYAAIAIGFGITSSLFICIALSGALIGFLPYNFKKDAAIFAGDTGALVVGFAFALLPILDANMGGHKFVLLAPLLLLPCLADVFMTLIRRVRRGENLAHAHRGHLYQLASRRWGHMLVASAYLIAVLPLTCLALVALLRDWNYLLEGLILLAIISAVLAAIAAKKLDAQERRSIT